MNGMIVVFAACLPGYDEMLQAFCIQVAEVAHCRCGLMHDVTSALQLLHALEVMQL